MRYLVTGGLGVIGSRIARRLLDAGHKVAVIDATEAPRNHWIRENIIPDAQAIPHRLESYPAGLLPDRIYEADAVIHCAASTGIPYSVQRPDDDWRSNVDATRALLEALRLNPRPTVVLSSVKPYAVPPLAAMSTGLDESHVLEPDEPYAASKAAQSMLTMAYARSYGLPVVTFRCSNLYGPAPSHGPRHGWLTWFAISAAIGRPLHIQGTGEQTRDMLHADDVFSACDFALKDAKRLAGRVFNLGGGFGNRISVFDAAKALNAMAGGGLEIIHAPPRAMDDLHVFANSGAFIKAIGWRPAVSVLDGLRAVYEWAVANRDGLRSLYEGV